MRIKIKRSRGGPDLWVPVCSTEREAMELELEEMTRIWCREVKSFVKGKESQPDGQQTARNSGMLTIRKRINKLCQGRMEAWKTEGERKGRRRDRSGEAML